GCSFCPLRPPANILRRRTSRTWGEIMRDLRDWHSYVERSVRDARPPSDPGNLAPPPAASGGRSLTRAPQARAPAAPAPAGPARPRRPRKIAMPVELQPHLPIDVGPPRAA